MSGLHRCAFCGDDCDGSFPYVLGKVRGNLCTRHGEALERAVTEWAARCIREQREERAKTRRERRKAIRLAAEQLPLASGRWARLPAR